MRNNMIAEMKEGYVFYIVFFFHFCYISSQTKN